MSEKQIRKDVIEDLLSTIEKELHNSGQTIYICEDSTHIVTDVCYVEEWFDEYKEKIRKKYCK